MCICVWAMRQSPEYFIFSVLDAPVFIGLTDSFGAELMPNPQRISI